MRKFTRSSQLLKQSQKYLAGGVSSMMRASNKPQPLFFRSAAGSRLTDVDGNRYLDYTLAWGPLILGHSCAAVVDAVEKQLKQFQLLGAQHQLEPEVARQICKMVPCAELVAFSNTGSEAVQLTLRLARAHTRKWKIIKFEGHYHGWSDNILVSYHPPPPLNRLRKPNLTSAGQSPAALNEVMVLPWNDPGALEETVRKHHRDIAAIITEPILCNSSCLMPQPGYLELMRKLSMHHGIVLIFDEVITGFRVAPGGAQELFGVLPDLATFGKAVASGFPLSVVAGKKTIMELIARGRVVHAGTFNGNPIVLAAARAALNCLDGRKHSVLKHVQTVGMTLMKGIAQTAKEFQIPVLLNGVGAAFHVSFTERQEMRSYRDTLDCNARLRDAFIEAMLEAGVYLLPDGRWYVSAAHSESDADFTLRAVRKSFEKFKAK